MALEVKEQEREFIIEETGITLPDLSSEMTVENIQQFYSSMYPQLTTATVHGPEFKDDKFVYVFKSIIGTKG